MPSTFAISMNLTQAAASQYTNYHFNSMATDGGVDIAADSGGLYLLSGPRDHETKIEAFFELFTTDLGIGTVKRLLRVLFGMKASGTMEVGISYDDDIRRDYSMPLIMGAGSGRQHGNMITPSGRYAGRYFTLRIANENGCDFAIDRIDVDFADTGRHPRP